MLQGQWCSIENDWTVKTPTETDLIEARRILDTMDDLWQPPLGIRTAIYYVMMQRAKESILKRFQEAAEAYNKNLKDLKIGKWERDAVYLGRAKIIGLTTTGLSKYRPLISSLKPKIVLIEEAAEVLEAPITVACMESVEHLILVGDHEQLQGHTAVRELHGDPYYLGTSLFERYVANQMPYTTLLCQRRMHPEFRKLLAPIYPNLRDHISVQTRPLRDCRMGDARCFFLDHQWYESRDGQMSIYNDQEAKYIAGFYRYLVLNGVHHAEITILTLYNGQRKRLLKEIRAFPELKEVYNNVKTVDSYQGEENQIILLSLARHNLEHKIGFLENRNRVCVALSRAKVGFYIFGSTKVLANDALWMLVAQKMKANQRLSSSMTILCKPHRKKLAMQHPEDWLKVIGGCDEFCNEVLGCGHECQLKCHPFSHGKVECGVDCGKQLPCGHACKKKCFQECFCRCPEFARIDGFAVESTSQQVVDDATMEELMNGRYMSGRSHLSREDRSYLPQQVSCDENPSQTIGMSGLNTMQQQLSMAEWSGDFDPQIWGNRISTEEQAESRKLWAGFANGGVEEDDQRRSQEVSPVEERNNVRSGTRNQKVVLLGNNRHRFTEEYIPSFNMAEEVDGSAQADNQQDLLGLAAIGGDAAPAQKKEELLIDF